ncbi:MAG TPA: glycoside hydrolase family 15 protein [Nitrospira sp.]|nr:glycoside hydrolase family 15 protein [Nitrospira sp.]
MKHLSFTSDRRLAYCCSMYPYALIGNCHASALVNATGTIEWMCLPRPDSPPVFGRLLDPDGGHFAIMSAAASPEPTVCQRYVPNTNIITTVVTSPNGDAFQITDFFPRFEQYGRMYRPAALFRIVEPLHGTPAVRVSCRPVSGWDKAAVPPIRGSNHLRYDIRGESLRLLTNMPLTYLCEETPVALTRKFYFALTWGVGIEDDLIKVTHDFLEQTTRYWRTWVKHCSVPLLHQQAVIRSALALKLHCFEDTGAILAAVTTSLPEQPGGGRNWDYRYCWLRDAYFTLSAFNNLGHFEEMESFLNFLLNIALAHEHSRDRLRPVYTLSQGLPLPEMEHPNWSGYEGSMPVRSHNQAADQVQNDAYGEMILTFTPIFFDERFVDLRTRDLDGLLAHLAQLCVRSIAQRDAGLWEIRSGWQEHSFTNLLCWAGLERLERIQHAGHLSSIAMDLTAGRQRAAEALLRAVRHGSVRNGPEDSTLDAALAQLAILGYPDRALCETTLSHIVRDLSIKQGNQETAFFYRYVREDDFGKPEAAFVICSFWIAQALARLGHVAEARSILDRVVTAANHLGLFSEHFVPETKVQCGNFPQAYSHVGLINAAFAVSPPWTDVL